MTTPREEAEILRLYGSGQGERSISAQISLPWHTVVEVVNRRCAGDRALAKREAQAFAALVGATRATPPPTSDVYAEDKQPRRRGSRLFTPPVDVDQAGPDPAPESSANETTPAINAAAPADVDTEQPAAAAETVAVRSSGPVEIAKPGELIPGPFLPDLLARAAASGKATTRALGTRLAGMAEQLQQALKAEEAAAAAREAELRARAEAHERLRLAELALAEAKAGVRQLTQKARAEAVATVAEPRPKPMTPTALIRAWAVRNGITCPQFGRVPASVTAAYNAAHPTTD